MADQLSLPNIGGSDMRLRGFGGELRSRRRRDHLGGDRVEESWIVEPKSGPGRLERLPGEFLVTVTVQNPIRARSACHPIGKCKLRHDVNVEQHFGKAIAAEMRREAPEGALIVGAQIKPR